MKIIPKKYIYYFVIIPGLLSGLNSCYYDNEEYLYPQPVGCDTVNISYSGVIAPILSDNCNGCHGGSSPTAGIATDNYDDLKIIVDNGKFWGSINHETGYTQMPKDKPRLSECDLKKINIWINNGALND